VSFAYLFIIFERCASTPTLKPLLLLRIVVSSLQRSYSDSRSIYPSNSVYSYGWAHALWCRVLHPQNKSYPRKSLLSACCRYIWSIMMFLGLSDIVPTTIMGRSVCVAPRQARRVCLTLAQGLSPLQCSASSTSP
jgi:hypothetical protein